MLIVPLGGPVVVLWRCPFPSVRVSWSVPSVVASLGGRSWPAYVVSSAIRSDLSDSSRSAQSRWSTSHDGSLAHFWWNHSTVITNANSLKNVVIGQRNSLEHLDIVSFHSTLHADSILPCDGLSLFLAQRRLRLVEHRNTRCVCSLCFMSVWYCPEFFGHRLPMTEKLRTRRPTSFAERRGRGRSTDVDPTRSEIEEERRKSEGGDEEDSNTY